MSLLTPPPLSPYIPRPHPPHARPTLKRSQSPYTSDYSEASLDRKRRRTSPTGAFAQLSLSPLAVPIQLPSTPALPKQLEPKLDSKPDPEPQRPAVGVEDQRMKSVYSAYDIDSHRIYVDCIGSEPSSPTEPSREHEEKFRLSIPRPPLPPMLDQQLVLYRPPAHLAIASSSRDRQEKLANQQSCDGTEEAVPMEID